MLAATSGTILLVDDNIEGTEHITFALQLEGFDVISTRRGEDALAILQRDPVDLVLLDVRMPVISGLEVLVMIRQRYTMEELPVILMSAHASDEDIVKGLNQQANDYFIKPFSLGMMLSRVRTHVALKQMADERRKIFNALQRANDMKNNLMRIASHDLRDPINTMTMVHEMLRRYIPDDDDGEVADLFDIAQRVTNNMNNIINEFLNSDILSGDEIKVQLHPVSLVDVLSGILVDFKQTLDSKDLQVRLDVPTTTVIADERRLRQVLTNLVSNAIKYTPPSSSITVTSQLDAETENCTLHIIDEGKGIPPAEMHRLFQPFGKLSTQPTAGEQSTGLGLWIVKQMVEAQRGEVGLNTTYTGGADFWIRLPAVTEPLATAP